MAIENRRPIKARSNAFFQGVASRLAKTNISPNQISILSIVFALLVPTAFGFWKADGLVAPLLAFAGIQLRLICNLLDGMVAIEGGKKSPLGDIYNEFPDRIADTVILLGFAMADWKDSVLLSLALLASFFAVMTAYTRVLGAAIGTKHYFVGPMAKQHRMALLTITALLLPILSHWLSPITITKAVMSMISVGCVITVGRRLRLIAEELRQKKMA